MEAKVIVLVLAAVMSCLFLVYRYRTAQQKARDEWAKAEARGEQLRRAVYALYCERGSLWNAVSDDSSWKDSSVASTRVEVCGYAARTRAQIEACWAILDNTPVKKKEDEDDHYVE